MTAITIDIPYDNEGFFMKAVNSKGIEYFNFDHVGKFIHGCGTVGKFYIVTSEMLYTLAKIKGEVVVQEQMPIKNIKRINNGCTYLIAGDMTFTRCAVAENAPEDKTDLIIAANPKVKLSDDYFLEHDDQYCITKLYDYENNQIWENGKPMYDSFYNPYGYDKRLYKTEPLIFYDGETDMECAHGIMYAALGEDETMPYPVYNSEESDESDETMPYPYNSEESDESDEDM